MLVTGANSGLGFFTSARLAEAGAHVVMSGRSQGRLDAAVRAIRESILSASVETHIMDQASLASVRAGLNALLEQPAIDVIVANAGNVHPPKRREVSVDGNELVMATNVLGHFVLVAKLIPTLSEHARVVSLGSLASKLSTFRTDDLQLRNSGSHVASVVVHPGYSRSGLTPRAAGVNEPRWSQRFGDQVAGFASQGKNRGAEIAVFAATAPDVEGGQY